MGAHVNVVDVAVLYCIDGPLVGRRVERNGCHWKRGDTVVVRTALTGWQRKEGNEWFQKLLENRYVVAFGPEGSATNESRWYLRASLR